MAEHYTVPSGRYALLFGWLADRSLVARDLTDEPTFCILRR
jgi:hypothetical protein